MDNKKSVISIIKAWAVDNSAIFVTALIPIMAGLIAIFWGFCKRVYWQAYYEHFHIDYKYVNLSAISEFADLGMALMWFLCAIMYLFIIVTILKSFMETYENLRSISKINKDPHVNQKVKKYLRKKTLYRSLMNLFSFCFFIALEIPCNYFISVFRGNYDIDIGDPDNLLLSFVNLYVKTIFYNIIFCVTAMCIISYVSKQLKKDGPSKEELIYKKIFPKDNHDEYFKKHQIEAITEIITPYKSSIFLKGIKAIETAYYPILFIGVFVFAVIHSAGRGQSDAISQREFLVTEDNKHVAIPVSEERYALIDMKEDDGCLILFLGKQNFHESNDFPCTIKEYRDVNLRY